MPTGSDHSLLPSIAGCKSWVYALMLTLFLVATSNPGIAAEGDLPPYEKTLRRLSAVVGALMHLDPLCNGSDPRIWHDQMQAILKAENPDDVRNRQLTNQFNQSYRTLSQTYSHCNSQAEKVTSLYRMEGQELLIILKLKHTR